jgi:hypothetical protein
MKRSPDRDLLATTRYQLNTYEYLVVVAVVPIALVVPAVLVFIPPPLPFTPATFPRLAQFKALVICPLAVASVFIDCLVEFMLRVYNSPLTSIEVFRLNAGHSRKQQKNETDHDLQDAFHGIRLRLNYPARPFPQGMERISTDDSTLSSGGTVCRIEHF